MSDVLANQKLILGRMDALKNAATTAGIIGTAGLFLSLPAVLVNEVIKAQNKAPVLHAVPETHVFEHGGQKLKIVPHPAE